MYNIGNDSIIKLMNCCVSEGWYMYQSSWEIISLQMVFIMETMVIVISN